MPDAVATPTIAGLFPPATRQLHEHRPILHPIRWRTGVELLEDSFNLASGVYIHLAAEAILAAVRFIREGYIPSSNC